MRGVRAAVAILPLIAGSLLACGRGTGPSELPATSFPWDDVFQEDEKPPPVPVDAGPPDEPLKQRPPDQFVPPKPAQCLLKPAAFPFDDPQLEFRWPVGEFAQRDAVHVCSTPLVIDLDPNDEATEPQLVFVSYSRLGREEKPGVLRIVNPRTKETISNPASNSGLGLIEPTSNLAAGDINQDGFNEIVGIGTRSGTHAFDHNGNHLWSSAVPTLADRGGIDRRSIGGAVTLADLEGDGTVEVIVGRNVIEGATGVPRWTGEPGTGRATNTFLGPISCVADLDGDGRQEVIAGHTAFMADGSVLWNRPELQDGYCAVADLLDSSPGPEVLIVSIGVLRVVEGSTGNLLWERQLVGRTPQLIGGAPTVADFDGDMRPEVGVAHGAAYGVYDPECIASGEPAGCFSDGILWKSDTQDDSSAGTGSSVFDFNGDGQAEVVYNDQFHFRVYDGTTGNVLFERPNSSRTRSENPTIADADGDGQAEIVFSANAEATFIQDFWTEPGIEVWGDRQGRWVSARRIWNQHAYHITNVEEDGSIASPESPSWLRLNAYRQNLREVGEILSGADLWGGRGLLACDAPTTFRLGVNVQNWGLEAIERPIVVALYREVRGALDERVEALRTSAELAPFGGSQTLWFEVPRPGVPTTWYARIDDPGDLPVGNIYECREENNEVVFFEPSCSD